MDRFARVVPLVRLVALYFAVMLVVAFAAGGAWRTADWYALRMLSGRNPTVFSQNVLLGDLAGYDGKDVRSLRASLAGFLTRAAALPPDERPKKVAVDIEFASGDTSPQTRAVKAAMQRARDQSISVYAVDNPPVEQSLGNDIFDPRQANKFDIYDAGLDSEIYQLVEAGHTAMDTLDGPDSLTYHECLTYPTSQGVAQIFALPLIVADRKPATCVPNETQIVLLGPNPAVPQNARGTLRSGVWTGPPLAGKIVVLGALGVDTGEFGDIAHPVLVAWAISEQETGAGTPVKILPSALLPVLAGGLSVCAILVFLGIFMPLRRRPMQHRLALPAVSAALAAAVTLALFAGLEVLLRSANVLQPRVALPAIGVVTAMVLGAVWGRRALLDDQRRFRTIPVEVNDYDVFISYVHDDAAWMLEHVYAPLCAARPAGGRELRIFYDKNRNSLFPGDAWIDKLMLSVDHSQFVIAVCSEAYFSDGHPWCLDEFRRAYGKWVKAPDAPCVFPLLRGDARIPQAFNNLQGLHVDRAPEAVNEIIDRIVTRLNSQEAAAC